MTKKNNYDYFKGFETAIAFSVKAAYLLRDVVANFNVAEIEMLKDQMHDIETAADAEKHEMHSYLIREFLPPLEEADIVELADDLDDVTDSIEDVLLNIYMFNVVRLRSDTLEFANLIVEMTEVLQDALSEFKGHRKSKTLSDKLKRVMSLEEDGDRLFLSSMKALTNTVIDPFEAIAWVRIYDAFERCCDKLDVAATTMETIILKNT